MELPVIFSLMDDLYESTGLPFCLCNDAGTPLHGAPDRLAATKASYYQYTLTDFKLQKRDMAHPLVLMLNFDLFIGIAQLADDLFLITAPVSPFEKKRTELMEFCTPAIEPEHLIRFVDLLLNTPLFPLRRFNAAFSLLIYLGCGRHISATDILLCNSTVSDMPGTAAGRELFLTRESLEYHADFSYEDGVCAALEAGDLEQMRIQLMRPVDGKVGQMSSNTLTQKKYLFVAFSTLLTRAAIRGGLPHETACSLADVYCQRMDQAFEISAIESLEYKMAMDFCQCVHEVKIKRRFSCAVQKCVEHINKHLHEVIRMKDLAALCGLCTRSVSLKFKAETGLSVSDYINQERVREAQYLLTHSDYSLAEISACLQYNSQSYFSQRFREVCGTTPQKYRDTHTTHTL